MNTTNILLEAGTRELEVILVEVGGVLFGVNVAKVREVILPVPVHRLPASPPSVEGVFELRGLVVELVDLRQYLALPEQSEPVDTGEPLGRFWLPSSATMSSGFGWIACCVLSGLRGTRSSTFPIRSIGRPFLSLV